MDAIELMTRFQRFEQDRGLFYQKVDGAPWWDSVRYEVHTFLGQVLLGRGTAATSPPLWRRVAASALTGAMRWKLYRELGRERPRILLIRAPRTRQADSLIDIIVDPIGDLFAGETKNIDTLPRRHHVPVIQKSARSGSVPSDLDKTIAALLDTFAIPHERAGDLEKMIRFRRLVFEAELRGYDRLFKRARPRMVVLVQNGLEKALFATAHAHGIPTAEIQHGLMGYSHASYSYSPDVDYSGQSTFPDLFLSFSKFWNTSCHYPAGARIPIGNDSYFVESMPAAPRGTAMVISAGIYHDTLASWVRSISALSPERRILYKLHPGQKRYAEQIVKEFADLPNIQVCSERIPAAALFKDISHVIAVCSTVAYEALQAGRGVCLIPEQDYSCHTDILGLPGVVVPATPEDLDRALDAPIENAEAPRFFDRFDAAAVRSALEMVMHESHTAENARP